jgi:AMP nucleosidase
MLLKNNLASKSDKKVTTHFVDMHLQIGIDSLNQLLNHGATIKHLRFE